MNRTTEFDFDTVVDRRDSASLKWDHYSGRDIIPFWVADMDFRSPPVVIKALHERISHGVFGYTEVPKSLVQTVQGMLAREYAWDVDPDWLVWLPGLVCGLHVACRTVGSGDDEVLTFTPVYPPFMSAPVLSGRSLVQVPLSHTDGVWGIDFKQLEMLTTDKCRMLMLCSPHNPVGRVWRREELQALADYAERHDLIICSDEIHAGLVLDQNVRHIPIATLSPEVAARTITLHAPSKTYNIPGLGCSFAVIPDDSLRRRFKRVMAGIVPHVNLFGYSAAEAAYAHGEPWRLALIEYLRENRRVLLENLAELPNISASPVEATYLAWIDFRGAGLAHPARFLEDWGVGLSEGSDFGLSGFARLNFGCSRSLLEEGVVRIGKAFSQG